MSKCILRNETTGVVIGVAYREKTGIIVAGGRRRHLEQILEMEDPLGGIEGDRRFSGWRVRVYYRGVSPEAWRNLRLWWRARGYEAQPVRAFRRLMR